MKKINFRKYNKLTPIDMAIILNLEELDEKNALIFFLIEEQQKLYILNLVTLICMTKEYNFYYHIEDEELDNLYENIKHVNSKNVTAIQPVIQKNISVINKILKKYYSPRNYIYPKYCNELIVQNEKGKNILLTNPFFINNHMEYFSDNRITENEKIINDIIEYYFSAQKIIGNEENNYDVLKLTKNIIIKNIKPEELENYILFIISNVYQEVMENITDEIYNQIKHIVENENINNNDIINYFLTNDGFSNIMLNKFLSYNMKIEQGRLEQLKTKSSFQYSRKLYRK